MLVFEFLLLAVAVAQASKIVSESFLFEKIRLRLARVNGYLGEGIGCQLCTGTWAGLVAAAFAPTFIHIEPDAAAWFADGMALAFVGRLAYSVVELLGASKWWLERGNREDEESNYEHYGADGDYDPLPGAKAFVSGKRTLDEEGDGLDEAITTVAEAARRYHVEQPAVRFGAGPIQGTPSDTSHIEQVICTHPDDQVHCAQDNAGEYLVCWRCGAVLSDNGCDERDDRRGMQALGGIDVTEEVAEAEPITLQQVENTLLHGTPNWEEDWENLPDEEDELGKL